MQDEASERKLWSLSGEVIAACVEVHRLLGPGLLESAYELCLARELFLRGIPARRQVPLPISYKGDTVDDAYRIDFLVDNALLVEINAVEKLTPLHKAQVITYLRMTGIDVGLLVNFHATSLRDGLRRLTREPSPFRP